MKIVYIIHGGFASAESHWFQWLRKELEKRNIHAKVLSMPHSDKPVKDEWLNYLQKNIITGHNTFIVAHSLGCISTLLFLNKTNAKIGGAILVAAFDVALKEFPELSNFTKEKIDYRKIIENTQTRMVIASPEDYFVPFTVSQKLAADLDASFISVPNAGHFMAKDGYEKFPLLLTQLKSIVD